jgi:hypothetical protein
MKHQLFHLYSILKILASFSFILFFATIFIMINEENNHKFYCGVASSPEDYKAQQPVSSDKLSIRGQKLFNEKNWACTERHYHKIERKNGSEILYGILLK